MYSILLQLLPLALLPREGGEGGGEGGGGGGGGGIHSQANLLRGKPNSLSRRGGGGGGGGDGHYS